MNRITIALLLLISVIGICIFEVLKIKNVSDKVINDLTLIQKYIADGDTQKALSLSSDVCDNWQNNNTIIAIFVQHDSLENIEQSLALMKSAIEQDEISSFWAENIRSIVQITNLSDTEFPNIENIL